MDKVEQNLGQRIKKTTLMPFSFLYGLGIRVRNLLFNLRILEEKRFSVPVISVGNLTAGGTGKTPMAILLAEHFFNQGKKVVVLSRGYGRKTKGFLWVDIQESWQLFGDEPCLIQWKLKNKCFVAVDEKRVHGIEKILIEKPDTDLILLDDGFQHRYVKPKINVLLCNFQRPFFGDFTFPSGLLREPRSSASRADVVVVTKCPVEMTPEAQTKMTRQIQKFVAPNIPIFYSSIGYGPLLPLFDAMNKKITQNHALVVSGIASPATFYSYLQSQGWQIKAMAYPDHYIFEERHIHKIVQEWQKIKEEAIIITTEKDGVRLREFPMLKNMNVFTLPIQTNFQDWHGFENYLQNQLSKA